MEFRFAFYPQTEALAECISGRDDNRIRLLHPFGHMTAAAGNTSLEVLRVCETQEIIDGNNKLLPADGRGERICAMKNVIAARKELQRDKRKLLPVGALDETGNSMDAQARLRR